MGRPRRMPPKEPVIVAASLCVVAVLAGLPASADLLAHFLKGKGTEVDYRPGSPISKQPLAFRFADGAPR